MEMTVIVSSLQTENEESTAQVHSGKLLVFFSFVTLELVSNMNEQLLRLFQMQIILQPNLCFV